MEIILPREEKERLYTEEEVASIVNKIKATPKDYLIFTYIKLFNVKNGPLFDKYHRRYANMIFNNFSTISYQLIKNVFLPKSKQLMLDELKSVNAVSCIFPNLDKGPRPVFIQFFDKLSGVQLRLLEYVPEGSSSWDSVIIRHDLMNKTVGYIGDFCINERNSSYCKNVNGQQIFNLPYSDGFISALFDLLVYDFPVDVVRCLKQLGSTLSEMFTSNAVIKDLVAKYKTWSVSKQHILGSDYAKAVVDNINLIHNYLRPFQFLPFSVGTVFGSVLYRFFLIFIRELYQEIEKPKKFDSALQYFLYLLKLQQRLQVFKQHHIVPNSASEYYKWQLQELEIHNRINYIDDSKNLKELDENVSICVDNTYTLALSIVDSIINQMQYLKNFEWMELKTPIRNEQVFDAYNFLFNWPTVKTVLTLNREVALINEKLKNLDWFIDSIAERWVLIVKKLNVSEILKIVEKVFSLPSCVDIVPCQQSHDKDLRRRNIIYCNLSKKSDDMKKSEDFFEDYFHVAETVVQKHQISLIED